MAEYETRFCAFVDILGFKNLVRGGTMTPDDILRILMSVRELPLGREAVLLSNSGLRFHSFSDNICVSAKCNADGIKHLLFSLESLAVRLLDSGTLLRGGIVKGKLYQDGDVVFGDALIRAVELESNVSDFPRIMLMREVADEARSLMRSSMQDDFIEDYILRSTDGPHYLNVLVGMKSYLRPGDAELRTIYIQRYRLVAARLQQQFDAAVDSPDHYRKQLWFARYWNHATAEFRDVVPAVIGPGTDTFD